MFRSSLIKWAAIATFALAAPVFALTTKHTPRKDTPSVKKDTKDVKHLKSSARTTPAPAAVRLGTNKKAPAATKHTTTTKHTLAAKKHTPTKLSATKSSKSSHMMATRHTKPTATKSLTSTPKPKPIPAHKMLKRSTTPTTDTKSAGAAFKASLID